MRTIEATIDPQGRVSLLESIQLPQSRRALVTIMEETPQEPASFIEANAAAILSESALAEEWNSPEEDAAWAHLQKLPACKES